MFKMRLRRQRHDGPYWGTCIWYAVLLSSCGPVDQESVRTVAALEIVPANNGDRSALVTLLRRHAATPGLHVDEVSGQWQQFEKQSALPPAYRSSFNIGVWRGANDDEAEVLADDRTHIGRIWLTFPRGTDPARSTRFREPLIADLRRHWPTSRFVPILPSGALPLIDDLMTENGQYRLKPTVVRRYKSNS